MYNGDVGVFSLPELLIRPISIFPDKKMSPNGQREKGRKEKSRRPASPNCSRRVFSLAALSIRKRSHYLSLQWASLLRVSRGALTLSPPLIHLVHYFSRQQNASNDNHFLLRQCREKERSIYCRLKSGLFSTNVPRVDIL